jgi:hypothetical protein
MKSEDRRCAAGAGIGNGMGEGNGRKAPLWVGARSPCAHSACVANNARTSWQQWRKKRGVLEDIING